MNGLKVFFSKVASSELSYASRTWTLSKAESSQKTVSGLYEAKFDQLRFFNRWFQPMFDLLFDNTYK